MSHSNSSNQSTQINLFSPAIDHKKDAIAALKHLQFSDFEEKLTLAKRIDPSLADLNSLIKIGNYLQMVFNQNKTVSGFLAKCWQDIPQAVSRQVISQSEGKYIDKLLPEIKRYKIRKRSQHSFFIDPIEILHEGCLAYASGKYESAHDKLLETLSTTHPFRADLWGYYGDVNLLLKNETEANAAYLRTLVLNPSKLDIFRLKFKQLSDLYTRLIKKYTDQESRSLLLIHGWLHGLFTISKGNTWLARQSKHLKAQLESKLPLYKHERWHRFSICLYLDQSNPPGKIDYTAREQMMELDGELFKKYLGRLR